MAWPRLVMSLSATLLSQPRMPSPAADWYTVIVTRSSDLAASNTMPATLLPISDVMSEHCRFVAAQKSPATPSCAYRVSGCLPAPAVGGATRESIPELAGSGSGRDGVQMLFREPVSPDVPSEQKPNSPPISPIPGTEHRPPEGVVTEAVFTLEIVAPVAAAEVAAMVVAGVVGGVPGPAADRAWAADAPPGTASTATSRAMASATLRGTRGNLGIFGGLLGVSCRCVP